MAGYGADKGGARKATDQLSYMRGMAPTKRRKTEFDTQYIEWLIDQQEAGFAPIRSMREAIAYFSSFHCEVIDDSWLRGEITYMKRNGIHPDTQVCFLELFYDLVVMKEGHRMILGNVQNLGLLALSLGDYESGTRSKPESVGKLSAAIARESSKPKDHQELV